MQKPIALPILKALADGIDPFTGEVLPDKSLYQQPQVIRALAVAVKTLEESIEQDQQRRREGLHMLSQGLLPEQKKRPESAYPFSQGSVLEQDQQQQKASLIPSNTGKPPNAGNLWNSAEDADLLQAFEAGATIQELVDKHQRTKGAITSRLARRGVSLLEIEARDTSILRKSRQEQSVELSPGEEPF